MKEIISVKDLSYAYGQKQLLKNISFSIEEGDFVGLIGGNGAGKSTLLKLMLGRLPLQSGEVKLFGTGIAEFKEWSSLAYIPQKAAAFNSSFPISVEELLGLPLNAAAEFRAGKRIAKSELSRRIDSSLAAVEMSDFRGRLLSGLSGGEAQRVLIAKALITKPRLLVLDEPTVGVDRHSEHNIYELLTRLNVDKGMSIIWVSHDVAAVQAHTSKILCLAADSFVEHKCKAEMPDNLVDSLYDYEVIRHSHIH